MAEVDLGKVAITQDELDALKAEIMEGIYTITVATEEPESVAEKEIVLVVEV